MRPLKGPIPQNWSGLLRVILEAKEGMTLLLPITNRNIGSYWDMPSIYLFGPLPPLIGCMVAAKNHSLVLAASIMAASLAWQSTSL